MTTNTKSAKVETTAAPAIELAPAALVTLTEFCTVKSGTLRRPELLAAFHRRMTSKEMERASTAEFEAALNSFLSHPV